MVLRSNTLARMSDAAKSVKILVIEENLRRSGLLAPRHETRGSVVDEATAEGVPEQQPAVSPRRRRPTGITIREPTGNPSAERPSAPQGKGKQKAKEPVVDLGESSDENGKVILLLNSLPIPCHLFDGEDNFTYTPNLGPDFFMPDSECVTNRFNSIATSSCSSGIHFVTSFLLYKEFSFASCLITYLCLLVCRYDHSQRLRPVQC